jgi:hypothetical protein
MACAARTADSVATDRARVGFWNLSGRDVALKVDGQVHFLAPGKSLKLDLKRQFVWREGENKPQIEQIPDNVPSMEIVVRR